MVFFRKIYGDVRVCTIIQTTVTLVIVGILNLNTKYTFQDSANTKKTLYKRRSKKCNPKFQPMSASNSSNSLRSQFLGLYHAKCEPQYYPECVAAHWLWRTLPFLLITIGTLGSLINLVILSRKTFKKKATSIFLLVLSVSDTITLWVCFTDAVSVITGSRFEHVSTGVCTVRWWIFWTTYFFSVWVLACFTIERTVSTCAPLYVKSKFTPSFALRTCLILFILVGGFNCSIFFGIHVAEIEEEREPINFTTNNSTKIRLFECQYTSLEYVHFWTSIGIFIQLCIYTVLPATIILVGNTTILSVICLRNRKMSEIVKAVRTPAKVLFFLSGFFFLTALPYYIFFFSFGTRGTPNAMSRRDVARWQLLQSVVTILLMSNHAFNVFFYLVAGTKFRQEWYRILKGVRNFFKPPSNNVSPNDVEIASLQTS